MLTLVSFLFAISLLVAVHEFGHYWVARRCGVKVLVFSIGFGKPLLQWRRGETIWQIAMIPLGGYVKMLGEEDEQVADVDLPRAFHKQSPLKRMAIVVAGPLANFLLAWLLYSSAWMLGVDVLRPMIGSVQMESAAALAGVQAGDQVLAVGDESVAGWDELRLAFLELPLSQQNAVLRLQSRDGGERLANISLTKLDIASRGDLQVLQRLGLSALPLTRKVAQIAAGSAAQKAGVQLGDVIVALDDLPVRQWSELHAYVAANPGKSLQLSVLRNGAPLVLQAAIQSVEENGRRFGRLGVSPAVDDALFESWRINKQLEFVSALLRGARDVHDMSWLTVKLFGRMLTGGFSAKQVSGPIGIAQYAGQSAALGVTAYLHFLAVISLSLGVLNLLPVPVLDGGHLLYHMAEFVRGRPLPDWLQSAGQRVGLMLLLGLMALAIFNDLYRLISG